MKIRGACRVNYPYLYDGDTQQVALQYGPTATPHAFVFDQQRILRYQGRIDNNPREELVTKREARDAIDSLLAGNPIAAPVTPAVGCSTKWLYKEAGANEELTQSNQQQASLEMISADQLAKLRTNAGSDRLLLVNFWATWCAPCVDEFPEIEKMVRMYVAKRPLDIVTVSINILMKRDSYRTFLRNSRRSAAISSSVETILPIP